MVTTKTTFIKTEIKTTFIKTENELYTLEAEIIVVNNTDAKGKKFNWNMV